MFEQFRKHELAIRKRFQHLRLLYGPGGPPTTTTSTITEDLPKQRPEQSAAHAPNSFEDLSRATSIKSISEADIDSTSGTVTEIRSPLESQIFERSVQPPHSRSQSFSSIASIPHLAQESMVPSVLDATCSVGDDTQSVEVICGHSGHPLSKRRTTSFSNVLNFTTLTEFKEEEDFQQQQQDEDGHYIVSPLDGVDQDVDYSDHTRLNFTSFADLVSDEEDSMMLQHQSPFISRKSSVVVVPLGLRSSINNIDSAVERGEV